MSLDAMQHDTMRRSKEKPSNICDERCVKIADLLPNVARSSHDKTVRPIPAA